MRRRKTFLLVAIAMGAMLAAAIWLEPVTETGTAPHAPRSGKDSATSNPLATRGSLANTHPGISDEASPEDDDDSEEEDSEEADPVRQAEDDRQSAEYWINVLYEDAGRVLGLDEDQNAALLDLLREHYVQRGSLHRQSAADAATLREMDRNLKEKQESELLALLGSAGKAALDRYWKTGEAQYEVATLNMRLSLARAQLTESQRRLMIDKVIQPGVLVPRREFSESESVPAVRQEIQARIEQNDQKLLSIARSILNSSQLEIYEALLTERRRNEINFRAPAFATLDEKPE